MRSNKTFDLAFLSIFSAIILILANVPFIGFIPFFGVSVTIIPIPLIIGAIVGGKRKYGIILGLVFGLMSMFIAYLRPNSPLDPIFVNPLVSVLPRVLYGWFVYEIYRLSLLISKNKIINTAVTAFVSTILHGLMVGCALVIFGSTTVAEVFGTSDIMSFLWLLLSTATIFEAIAYALIATPIVTALLKRFKGNVE